MQQYCEGMDISGNIPLGLQILHNKKLIYRVHIPIIADLGL
jgi:hypothetical protein